MRIQDSEIKLHMPVQYTSPTIKVINVGIRAVLCASQFDTEQYTPEEYNPWQ